MAPLNSKGLVSRSGKKTSAVGKSTKHPCKSQGLHLKEGCAKAEAAAPSSHQTRSFPTATVCSQLWIALQWLWRLVASLVGRPLPFTSAQLVEKSSPQTSTQATLDELSPVGKAETSEEEEDSTDCDEGTSCESSFTSASASASASEEEDNDGAPGLELSEANKVPICFRPPPGLFLPSEEEKACLPLDYFPPGLCLPDQVLPEGRSEARCGLVAALAALAAPGLATLPAASPELFPIAPPPGLAPCGSAPPGLGSFGTRFEPKAAFDRAAFRKRLTLIFKQLALDRNTGRAIQAVREEAVPQRFQKSEYVDIITRISEMRNSRNRRILFAFAAGLSSVFEKQLCFSAIKEHVQSGVPELLDEVPHLPTVMLTELIPVMSNYFSSVEVEYIKTELQAMLAA